MRFWDSSAILPLVYREVLSAQTSQLYNKDKRIVVWMLTPTEVISALCRRRREGSLSGQDFSISPHRLHLLGEEWIEVNTAELVRERAHRVLETHPLRAADALQLASALIATEERPQGFEFVTHDRALALAAAREGFTVVP